MTLKDFSGKRDSRSAAVLLLGDGPTALSALRSLVESCRVIGVIRGIHESEVDPVRVYAALAGIPVSALDHLRELPRIIAQAQPVAVVVSSFHRILSPEILRLSRFVNVHYSSLPQYRGRANVNWAVINGEKTIAISIHLIGPNLDAGNILFQQQIPIQENDTVTSLYDRLNAIQEHELGPAVLRAIAGDGGVPQDHDKATYGCTRVPDDGEIDWSQSSEAIDRLIRALAPPYPGAFTHFETQPLVIARAAPLSNPRTYRGRIPGRIVGLSPGEGWIDVLTGDGILRVFEVIPAPGNVCPAAAVIQSTRVTLGISRLDLLRRIEALEERLAILETAHRL